MSKRMNPGKSSDLPVLHDAIEFSNPASESMEFWTIYDRGEKNGFRRWKLAASAGTTVLGTANYTLNVKGNQLFTNDDGSKLRADRPALFTLVEQIAAGQPLPSDTLQTEEADAFGDMAISRGYKLTQLQMWNRALLNMRVYELHWECRPDKDDLPPGVVRASSWEQGVRQSWFGIFKGDFGTAIDGHGKSIAADARKLGTFSVDTNKTKPNWNAAIEKLTRHLTRDMSQETIDDAIAFIKRRGADEINYDSYTTIVKKFHDGEYKPTSYQTLAAMLDAIAGVDSIPVERGIPPVDKPSMEDLLS